jgi:undecaprenyl-diphosphatase
MLNDWWQGVSEEGGRVADQTTPDPKPQVPHSAAAESVTVAADPVVAQASPARWWAWLLDLTRYGWERIAALGLSLGLGLGAALLALYLFAALADEVMEQQTLQIDTAVLMTLRAVQSPALDWAAYVVSALGSEVLAVLMVLLLGVLAWQRRWGAAVGLLLTVVGAQMLNNVLKDWFHRTRPAPLEGLIPAQAFSFPSGHAMVAAAFYLFVGYLAWRILSGKVRIVCTVVLIAVALLIGLSRLYLGVHYLTDVVAGYIAGFAWTDAVIIGGHLLARRSGRRVAGPPEGGAGRPSFQGTARRQNGARST